MVESAAYHHKKAVSTTLPPAQAPPQLPAQRALQPGRAKALSYIFDGLVKSHIPYVVHASTKPVLSEPFVPSTSSGRTVGRSACPE